MEIRKNDFGGTSLWAPILLEQFENRTGWNTEQESTYYIQIHISLPTFRDMYLRFIVQKKLSLISYLKFTIIKHVENNSYKNLFFILFTREGFIKTRNHLPKKFNELRENVIKEKGLIMAIRVK